MTELPEELLRDWPGRFRFGELLTRLARADRLREADVIDAVLAGIIAGHDEIGVLHQLVSNGEFAVAEEMLDHCRTLDEIQIADVSARLEQHRADRLGMLSERLQQLRDRAKAADLAAGIDEEALAQQAHRAWPLTDARLTDAEKRLAIRIDQRAEDLQSRLKAAGLDAATTETCSSLIAAGQLQVAEYLLDHNDAELPGPAAVPALSSPPWPDAGPAKVLQWHLNPAKSRPPDFATSVWASDDAGKAVLEQFGALSSGGEAAARGFAEALDRFLGPVSHAGVVHPVPGGFLTKLHNAFHDPRIARFRPTGTIDLFIADPDTALPPDELGGMGPFAAVGPALNVPDSGDSREPGGVLGVADLLRLVTAPARRPVQLLRILGRQWPLAAFRAGSPTELEELLGDDEAARWDTLSWLVNLTGLGDLTDAGALAFQTGLDARLLNVLLDFLAGPGVPRSQAQLLQTVRRWPQDRRLAAAVEAAVLHPFRDSPHARAAFWAALAVGPPDGPVTLDELVRVAAVTADSSAWARDRTLEEEIARGLAELTPLWLVEEPREDSVRLRRCGALIALSGWAQPRLTAVLDLLAGQATGPARTARRSAEATRWERHRHALSPGRAEYDALVAAEADEAAIGAAWQAMARGTRDVLDTNPQVVGHTDLAEVATGLRDAFTARYPAATLTVEAPPTAVAAVPAAVAHVLFYELLTNAAEALANDGGSVSVTMRAEGGDLILDVRDTGPGISDELGGEHRVFRDGVSTRGAGRGRGLYVARQLALRAGGDLMLVARSGSHPVLRGAHFRLVLPQT